MPNKANIKDECQSLGYGGRELIVKRHTINFYTSFAADNDLGWDDLRDEAGNDTKNFCLRFLESKCACKDKQFRHVNGQQHGQLLWPETGRLTYPRNKAKITGCLGRIFIQQHTSQMYLRESKSKKANAPPMPGKVATTSRPDAHAVESASKSASNNHDPLNIVKCYVATLDRRPYQSASNRSEQGNGRKVTKTQDPIDEYLSELYSAENHPPMHCTPCNTAEPRFLNEESKDLLYNAHYDFGNNLKTFIARYVHEKTLYSVDKESDFVRLKKGLVSALKNEAQLTCHEDHDMTIAKTCKDYIKSHVSDWINKGFLERDSVSLQIRQHPNFSAKLEIYRDAYIDATKASEFSRKRGVASRPSASSANQHNITPKKQRTGESSTTHYPQRGVDADIYNIDNDPSDMPQPGLSTNLSARPLKPKKPVQTPSVSFANKGKSAEISIHTDLPNDLSDRRRQVTQSPGTARPTSPLEKSFTGPNQRSFPTTSAVISAKKLGKQRAPELEIQTDNWPSPQKDTSSMFVSPSDGEILSGASLRNIFVSPRATVRDDILSGPSRQQDTAQIVQPSAVADTISALTLRPSPNRSIFTPPSPPKTPPRTRFPKIRICFKVFRPKIWVKESNLADLNSSVTEFFDLYSQESRILPGDFEALRFNFPNAHEECDYLVKNDETDWKGLKQMIEELFEKAKKAKIRKGEEFVLFRIIVAAVPLNEKAWNWPSSQSSSQI